MAVIRDVKEHERGVGLVGLRPPLTNDRTRLIGANLRPREHSVDGHMHNGYAGRLLHQTVQHQIVDAAGKTAARADRSRIHADAVRHVLLVRIAAHQLGRALRQQARDGLVKRFRCPRQLLHTSQTNRNAHTFTHR